MPSGTIAAAVAPADEAREAEHRERAGEARALAAVSAETSVISATRRYLPKRSPSAP